MNSSGQQQNTENNKIDDLIKNLNSIKAGADDLLEVIDNVNRAKGLNEKEFLSTKEVSEYTGLSIQTIRKYSSLRKLPYYKVGRLNFYLVEDVKKFILNPKNRRQHKDEIITTAVTKVKTELS